MAVTEAAPAVPLASSRVDRAFIAVIRIGLALPRITLDLRAAGWQVGENTVAGRMAALGLAGRAPKRRRSLTLQGKGPAPGTVRRTGTAAQVRTSAPTGSCRNRSRISFGAVVTNACRAAMACVRNPTTWPAW